MRPGTATPAGEDTHRHPVDPERVARARDGLPSREEVAESVAVLSVIAEPVRARVLSALLLVDELCVGDLAAVVEAPEAGTSYALRVLRMSGLVKGRKEGRVVFYRLADGFPRELLRHCLPSLPVLAQGAQHEDEDPSPG